MGRRYPRAAVLAMLAAGWAGGAAAQPPAGPGESLTAAYLQARCAQGADDPASADAPYCEGFLDGLANMHEWMEISANRAFYCVARRPEPAALARVFLAWAVANPDRLREEKSAAVLAALRAAHPCC